MKKTYIIGIVWTAIIVCIISFGATVHFLENNSNETQTNNVYNEKKENEQQVAYITNQSSIRTNNLANMSSNSTSAKVNDKKTNDTIENNIKNQIKNDEEIDAEEMKSIDDLERIDDSEILESLSSNINSFIRPIKGEVLNPLSVDELVYSKTLKEWNIHKGTDYKAQLGDEVYAIRNGKIKEIDFDYVYGDYIIVEFDGGYEGVYSNITVLDAFKVGDSLKQGQVIGYVAESFGFEVAEETHLHFELKKDEKYISI